MNNNMFIVSISIIATEGNGGVMTRRAQRRVVAGDEKRCELTETKIQAAIPTTPRRDVADGKLLGTVS